MALFQTRRTKANKAKTNKDSSKEHQWYRVQEAVSNHKNVVIVDVNDMNSLDILKIRVALREIDAQMIMGKNTFLKAALIRTNKKPQPKDEDYEERKDTWKYNPNIKQILPELKGNTGLIFTNSDCWKVKAILNKVERPLTNEAGMIAPHDVVIQPGCTGLEPKQTCNFQRLGIRTKFVKAKIYVVEAKIFVQKGQKMCPFQANVLNKLKIHPIILKMLVKKVIQSGEIQKPKKLIDLSKNSYVHQKNNNFLVAEFNCTLCCGIAIKPVKCQRCETVFCRDCLPADAFPKGKKQPGDYAYTCYNKCGSRRLSLLSRTELNVLNSLTFKCQHSDEFDCQEVVKYEFYKQHLEQDCVKKLCFPYDPEDDFREPIVYDEPEIEQYEAHDHYIDEEEDQGIGAYWHDNDDEY